MALKQCFSCGFSLPVTPEYFYRNKTKKDGLSGQCIECKKAWKKSPAGIKSAQKARKRYKSTLKGKKMKKKEQKRYNKSDSKKNSRLKCLYGITLGKKLDLYVMQSGRCAICKQAIALDEIVVDHSHKTDKVRGLLCDRCNIGIGCLKDSPEILRNAIKYLKNDI